MYTKKIIAAACAAVTIMATPAALPQGALDTVFENVSVSAADTTVDRVVMRNAYSCTTNAIRLNWSKVKGATGYRVFRYDITTRKWIKVATVIGTTTYRDEKLDSGVSYRYRVRAYTMANGVTTEGKSSATFSAATKPAQVVFTSFSRTTNAIRLNWGKTTCMGYKIYQLKDNKWYEIGSADKNTTTFRAENLTPGTSYSFMITAYTTDTRGKTSYSVYSKSLDVMTKSAPIVDEKESVTMPAEVKGKVNEAIVVKADTNVGGFRVRNVVLSSETDPVTYSYTYSGDAVTFKFNSADTAKFKIVLYSTKGTRVVCTTTVTAE